MDEKESIDAPPSPATPETIANDLKELRHQVTRIRYLIKEHESGVAFKPLLEAQRT